MKRATEVPGTFQNVVELIVEMLDNMANGVMGKYAVTFRNYIGTIFIFILFSNISGLFGLRPPTADYGTTLALGLMSFTIIHFVQFKHNSLKTIGVDMCSPLPPWLPIWFPINLIGEVAVPLSLSLRLFGNIMSGTILLGLIYGLLPAAVTIGIPSVIHAYCDIFSGAIQTYVFCMLSLVYINDKISD